MHILCDHTIELMDLLKECGLNLAIMANHGCEALHKLLNQGFQRANSHKITQKNCNDQQLERSLRLFAHMHKISDMKSLNNIKLSKSLKCLIQEHYVKKFGTSWFNKIKELYYKKFNSDLPLQMLLP